MTLQEQLEQAKKDQEAYENCIGNWETHQAAYVLSLKVARLEKLIRDEKTILLCPGA